METATLNSRLIPVLQYSAPTTGSTVSVTSGGNVTSLINPAGSLLALTVTLPGSPVDGDRVNISSSQAVTTVTMNGGAIINALTSFIIGSFASFVFSATAGQWFRAA